MYIDWHLRPLHQQLHLLIPIGLHVLDFDSDGALGGRHHRSFEYTQFELVGVGRFDLSNDAGTLKIMHCEREVLFSMIYDYFLVEVNVS